MSYNAENVRITVDGEEISPDSTTAEIPRSFNREVMVIESRWDLEVEQVIINGVVYKKEQEDK